MGILRNFTVILRNFTGDKLWVENYGWLRKKYLCFFPRLWVDYEENQVIRANYAITVDYGLNVNRIYVKSKNITDFRERKILLRDSST